MLSAQFETVSVVDLGRHSREMTGGSPLGIQPAADTNGRPPLISSAVLEYHPDGVCCSFFKLSRTATPPSSPDDFRLSGTLLAMVITDADGHSCVLFLSGTNMQPLRHVVWCNFEPPPTGESYVPFSAPSESCLQIRRRMFVCARSLGASPRQVDVLAGRHPLPGPRRQLRKHRGHRAHGAARAGPSHDLGWTRALGSDPGIHQPAMAVKNERAPMELG